MQNIVGLTWTYLHYLLLTSLCAKDIFSGTKMEHLKILLEANVYTLVFAANKGIYTFKIFKSIIGLIYTPSYV